jgi:hypothetical protein
MVPTHPCYCPGITPEHHQTNPEHCQTSPELDRTAVHELMVFSNVVSPFPVFTPSFIGSNQDNSCTIISVKTAIPLHTKSSHSKTEMTQQI